MVRLQVKFYRKTGGGYYCYDNFIGDFAPGENVLIRMVEYVVKKWCDQHNYQITDAESLAKKLGVHWFCTDMTKFENVYRAAYRSFIQDVEGVYVLDDEPSVVSSATPVPASTTRCAGCGDLQPNQEAHMEPNGCLSST